MIDFVTVRHQRLLIKSRLAIQKDQTPVCTGGTRTCTRRKRAQTCCGTSVRVANLHQQVDDLAVHLRTLHAQNTKAHGTRAGVWAYRRDR
jgi:hypothetical protein